MDYYFSLLESYQQIKQRKFKLTLHEQQMDAVGKARGFVSQAKSAVGKDQAISVPGAGGKQGLIWTAEKTNKVTFADNQEGSYAKAIEGETGEGWEDLVSFLSGSEDADDGPVDVLKDDKVLQAQQNIVTLLRNMVYQEVFPDVKWDDPNYKKSDVAKRLERLAQGKLPGTPTGRQSEDFDQSLMASYSEDKTVEELLETFAAEEKLFKAYGNLIKHPEALTDEALNELAEQVVITPNGVQLGGLFRQYKSSANRFNDPYMSMALALQEEIKKRNEGFSTDVKPISEIKIKDLSKVDPPSRPITADDKQAQAGQDKANRGIIAEKLEKVSIALDKLDAAIEAKDKKAASAARAEVNAAYAEAVKDRSAEDIMKMFDAGQKTLLGQYIANKGDMEDAEYIDGIKNILKDEGYSDKEIEQLCNLAGEKEGVGLALVIVASRRFSKDLWGDTLPEELAQTGQDRADTLGSKADLSAVYSDCETAKAAWDNKFSPEQKAFYASDPCINNLEGVGMDSMFRDVDGGGPSERCSVDLELKVVEDEGKKVSYGEGSTERVSQICDGEEQDSQTTEFLKIHQKRLDDCDMGNIADAACDFQKKLDQKMSVISDALTPPSSRHTPTTTLQQRQDFLDEWKRLKTKNGKIKKDDLERFEGAQRALGGPDAYADLNLSDEELKKKIKKDKKHALGIKNQLIQAELDSMIGDGVVEGEDLAYICQRMGLSGGSTQETVKVGRKLADEVQTVGLNNAEVYGCMKGLQDGSLILYKKGNSYAILNKEEAQAEKDAKEALKAAEKAKKDKKDKTKEQKKKDQEAYKDAKEAEKKSREENQRRFTLSFERGRIRLISGKPVVNKITTGTGVKKAEEDIMHQFLRGQLALLEKLVNQTT
jgi:hypothetical protein